MTTRKSTLKNIVSGCAVRSEHHIDILNAKSIGKEYLTSSSPSHLSKSFLGGFKKFKKEVRKEVQKEPPKEFFRTEEVLGN